MKITISSIKATKASIAIMIIYPISFILHVYFSKGNKMKKTIEELRKFIEIHRVIQDETLDSFDHTPLNQNLNQISLLVGDLERLLSEQLNNDKITCAICGTKVSHDDVSEFFHFGGLPSPCCKICFEVNDYSIKSLKELAIRSLLKRAEK